MKLNIHSSTYTLPPGAISEPVSIVGRVVVLSAATVNGYTTDLAIKLNDLGFKRVPTGFKVETPDGETFSSVQFKNTSTTATHTFHALAINGDAENYNLNLNGDISVATVTIDDATPVKVTQQGAVVIDDSTPVDVALPGGVAVDEMAALLAKLERIAVATETTAGA